MNALRDGMCVLAGIYESAATRASFRVNLNPPKLAANLQIRSHLQQRSQEKSEAVSEDTCEAR